VSLRSVADKPVLLLTPEVTSLEITLERCNMQLPLGRVKRTSTSTMSPVPEM
jgi:hypothetical protein